MTLLTKYWYLAVFWFENDQSSQFMIHFPEINNLYLAKNNSEFEFAQKSFLTWQWNSRVTITLKHCLRKIRTGRSEPSNKYKLSFYRFLANLWLISQKNIEMHKFFIYLPLANWGLIIEPIQIIIKKPNLSTFGRIDAHFLKKFEKFL